MKIILPFPWKTYLIKLILKIFTLKTRTEKRIEFSFYWPAAVEGDDLIDFGHEADGFFEGDDDAVVVGDVFRSEFAVLAIFEPLFADLISADVEVPNIFGHSLEALRRIDPDRLDFVADFDNFVAAFAVEFDDWLV